MLQFQATLGYLSYLEYPPKLALFSVSFISHSYSFSSHETEWSLLSNHNDKFYKPAENKTRHR